MPLSSNVLIAFALFGYLQFTSFSAEAQPVSAFDVCHGECNSFQVMAGAAISKLIQEKNIPITQKAIKESYRNPEKHLAGIFSAMQNLGEFPKGLPRARFAFDDSVQHTMYFRIYTSLESKEHYQLALKFESKAGVGIKSIEFQSITQEELKTNLLDHISSKSKGFPAPPVIPKIDYEEGKIALSYTVYFKRGDTLDGLKIPADEIYSVWVVIDGAKDDGIEKLWELPSIEHIVITDSNISSIPEKIVEFKRLRTLILRNCWPADSLPDGIAQLSTLKRLELEMRNLKQIPRKISKLANLEELVISSSKIKEFPDGFGKLSKLRVLSLLTGLNKIPEEVGNLDKLEVLRLGETADFRFLKGNFRNLRELGFSTWSTEYLPDRFSEMQSLKSLFINYKALKALPPSINGLINLEEVTLQSKDGNALHIPIRKGGWPKLKKMELYWLDSLPGLDNPLEGMEDLKIYPGLKSLKGIEKFPNLLYLKVLRGDLRNSFDGLENLKKLKMLNLYDCGIGRLPEEIFALKEIEEIYLNLNDIREIPPQVSSLPKLKRLSLAGNTELEERFKNQEYPFFLITGQ